YRMRARLHVRGMAAGFFREGSHQVCDAGQTRQLLPATIQAIDGLLEAARSAMRGALHEIELAENAAASERVVHVEAEAMNASMLDRFAAAVGFTGVSSADGARGTVT